MKKILLIIAALLFAGFASQAQVGFGLKAGANFYKFSGRDADWGTDHSPVFRTGFAGGGLVNIPINEMFSVQPEILYSMEGSRFDLTPDDLVEKVDYINVPVLFQYHASGFYGETGPQAGFLVSAKETMGSESADIKHHFRDFNFSWAIGLGYKMSNGFGIGARYNIGITDVIDDPDITTQIGGFHVGVFYIFTAKGK